ncbi:YL1 nuclear protein-domain-containing protein [Cercophora scortea]|uniref:YL1 nuclear protein-domain-containing protein n=1 Tax=Cercophora scortea TaxID=314031 RepID=A0AAE0IXQ7_9PEZI|nr:YL1 nuclear protein-domain-containing protein [Cercophora scortea]
MAPNDDESMVSARDDELSDSGSTSGSDVDVDADGGARAGADSDSPATEPPKIEWLATTREKRSTAGNRMKAMLANEEPAAEDSDLELLFASDEDDAGFTEDEKEAASDVHMDSSSDDEDQDDGGDDLTGEKELERQAREKRTAQRKRKAQEAIPAKFRKKVRIEQPATTTAASAVTTTRSASPISTTATTPQPRPKKKSERLSWLPTALDAPTRASERHTTRISKQQLHEKMVTDEIKRRKQLERMEKAAKRAEALKKPPMTQAQRLEEAALVEKRNSKSLNRWEVAEKTREEERLRKIAALHSRKLDGPVVTFWSGIQTLEAGQLKHVGKMVSIEEKAPRKKRQSVAATLACQEPDSAKAGEAAKTELPAGNAEAKPVDAAPPSLTATVTKPEASEPEVLPPPLDQAPQTTQHSQPGPPQDKPELEAPVAAPAQGPMAPPPETKQPPSAVLAAPILSPPSGLAPPMLGGQMSMVGFPASNGKSNVLALPNTSQGQSPLSPPAAVPSPSIPALPKPAETAPVAPAVASHKTLAPLRPVPNTPLKATQGRAPPKSPATPQETPTGPPLEGKVTRSAIILQNFDETAIKDRQVQTQILFGRKMNKLAKPAHAPLCVITNHPAKYRDVKTGLPYSNSYAFREIQRVARGDYKWSGLLGAYVGRGDYAARGVPERFLDPTGKRSTPSEPTPAPKEDVLMAENEQQSKERTPSVTAEAKLELIEPAPGVGAVAEEGAEGSVKAPLAAPSSTSPSAPTSAPTSAAHFTPIPAPIPAPVPASLHPVSAPAVVSPVPPVSAPAQSAVPPPGPLPTAATTTSVMETGACGVL